MKFGDFFRKWGLNSIKLNLKFAELEFSPTEDDQTAAWDMYVELITRITTQPLAQDEGDEATALESVYSIFGMIKTIVMKITWSTVQIYILMIKSLIKINF